MFCHSFITIPRLRDLKTNPHTQFTSRPVISLSNCFRTLTDNLSLWVTGSIRMLVFSGGAQSFMLLGEILDYSDVNLNMREDSQVTTNYTILSLCMLVSAIWDIPPILFMIPGRQNSDLAQRSKLCGKVVLHHIFKEAYEYNMLCFPRSSVIIAVRTKRLLGSDS